MVSKALFSTGKDNWATPAWLFSKCSEMWSFRLDACAEKWSAKCDNWYSADDNRLLMQWQSWTWCNPPYSNIQQWLEKAANESRQGASSVVLIPSRTDTRAFHRYAPRASRVFFIKGRLKFIDPETKQPRDCAPFPSMLLEFDAKYRGSQPSVEFLSWAS